MFDQTNLVELLRMADLLPPVAIRAAATLRLPDHIAAGAISPRALAERTSTHLETLTKLLAYLETIGLVRQEDGDYGLTERGALLADDAEGSMRRFLDMEGLLGRSELALVGMLHTLRSGEVSYPAVFGRHYWDDVNRLPMFAASLETDSLTEPAWDAHLVIEGYDWRDVNHVVDVGGNNGTMLIALLRRHAHLRGTLVDLHNLATLAARRFDEAGLSDRCEAVVGSFFEPLPTGGDVYLLSAILSDWSDEDAGAILRRCRDAAGASGRVLVAEVNLDFSALEPADRAAAELRVTTTVARPSRTVDDLTRCAGAAGLRPMWAGPATAHRLVLELAPEPSVVAGGGGPVGTTAEPTTTS